MKSIKYILLVVILSSVLLSAIPVKFKRYKKEVVLECVSENAKKEDIVKSVIILKNRLNASGLNYKLRLKDDNTISINFRTEADYTIAGSLIFSQASFGFYLPYENSAGIDKLLKNAKLSGIYNGKIKTSDNYESTVLLVSDENKKAVENVIQTDILTDSEYGSLITAWSKIKNKDGMWEFFLLEKSGYLSGANVVKSYSQLDERTNNPEVMIELSEEGAEMFSKMTAENINKNLTIVLDGEAYSSPKVMNKIDGGKCVISGNFTKDEAKDLAALIQYGELPLKFRIAE